MTVVALLSLSLSLGIAATTAIFQLIESLRYRQLAGVQDTD